MCDLTESWQDYAEHAPSIVVDDAEIERLAYYYERFELSRRFLFGAYVANPNECWAKYSHERWGKRE